MTGTARVQDDTGTMVRWWATFSIVAMMTWSGVASAQSPVADRPPPDEAAVPENEEAGETAEAAEDLPPSTADASNRVPPGATDEALMDLTGDDPPATAPEAYPSAAAPLAPAYVPPTHSDAAPSIPPAPRVEGDLPRRSVGMMVTGIVLTSLGAIAALTGAAIAGDAENCEGELCRRVDAHAFGVGLGVGGLAVIGAGIPLLVVGAQRVTPERTVSLSVGPGAFRLRSSF